MKRARKAQGKCESLMRNQAPEPSCIISTEWISHAKIITLNDSETQSSKTRRVSRFRLYLNNLAHPRWHAWHLIKGLKVNFLTDN